MKARKNKKIKITKKEALKLLDLKSKNSPSVKLMMVMRLLKGVKI